MINKILISAFLFTIGAALNAPLNEPKLYWIPLGIMLFFLFDYVFKTAKAITTVQKYCLLFFYALCTGNIVKQITYTEESAQYGDYIWGAAALVILLIFIMLWEMQKRRRYKKSGRG